MRGNAMTATMSRQKCNSTTIQRSKHDSIRRFSKRSYHFSLFGNFNSVHLIQPTAADDTDWCFVHVASTMTKLIHIFSRGTDAAVMLLASSVSIGAIF